VGTRSGAVELRGDRETKSMATGEAAAFELLRTMLARRAHALQGERFLLLHHTVSNYVGV
jgi:hypothetical protein